MSESQGRLRVLYVDDDRRMCELFRISHQASLDVRTVQEPAEALVMLEQGPCDAVVTDYCMPKMNGLEFLRAARAKHPDIPVIFYTGQGSETVAREAFLAGVTDYFVKDMKAPAHRERLVHAIEKAVERRRMEETLRSHEDILARTSAHAHVGHWEWHVASGAMEWTDETFRILGMEPGARTPDVELFLELVHWQDSVRVRMTVEEVRRRGTSMVVEFAFVRVDGIERAGRVMGDVVTDETGAVVRYVGSLQDITELRRAEYRLFQSEAEKTAILEGLKDVIIEYYDPEMRIIWSNASGLSLSGLTGDQLKGQICYEVMHGRCSPCPECTVVKAIKTGEFQEDEVTRDDGKTWLLRSNPVVNHRGVITGVVHIAMDVTAQKSAWSEK